MKNDYYVYVHRKLTDDSIFYVGKGRGYRHLRHSKKDRSEKWHNFANKYGWYSQIVFKNLDEELAYFVEEEFIVKCKLMRCDLVNFTKGGFGGKPVNYTEEAKLRISQTLKEHYKDKQGPRVGALGLKYYKNGKSEKFSKLAWTNLDIFWKYFKLKKSDRALSRVFPDISRMVFKKIIQYFEEFGDPSLNQEWVDYKKSNWKKLPRELPMYFVERTIQYESFLKIIEIQNMVKEGFGQKYILKKLELPYPSLPVVGKIKSGIDFSKDPVTIFCLNRVKLLENKILTQSIEEDDDD